MSTLSFSVLEGLARQSGFFVAGCASLAPLTRDVAALQRWAADGRHADQDYLPRTADLLLDPRLLLPAARSLVVVGVRYPAVPVAECPPGFGRIARYAVGRDYHRVVRRALHGLVSAASSSVGRAVEARVAVDSAPLMERALAERAGLGFFGKNTLIIRPGEGSFFFLAEILWDLDIEDVPSTPPFAGCRSCTRCLSACPTGALPEPGVLDSRRCIAYLTIEKRGLLEAQERLLLGEWLFGCDRCQEVCPFNARALGGRQGPLGEAFRWNQERAVVDLRTVLALRTAEEFVTAFGGTPVMRAKREGLLRNAICVAVNTRSTGLEGDLRRTFMEDRDPMVRATALWGIVSLAPLLGTLAEQQAAALLAGARRDSHEIVHKEAELLLRGDEGNRSL